MSRGRGGEPKTPFPFLSLPAPLLPATTFFAPFSTMPLCVSRSWILAPLSLKETETTTTQAKISVNHAASRVAVKSRVPSRNLAFSRIPHYSSLKSRIPRIPCRPCKYPPSDLPCDHLQICFSNQSSLTSCLISLSFQQ